MSKQPIDHARILRACAESLGRYDEIVATFREYDRTLMGLGEQDREVDELLSSKADVFEAVRALLDRPGDFGTNTFVVGAALQSEFVRSVQVLMDNFLHTRTVLHRSGAFKLSLDKPGGIDIQGVQQHLFLQYRTMVRLAVGLVWRIEP